MTVQIDVPTAADTPDVARKEAVTSSGGRKRSRGWLSRLGSVSRYLVLIFFAVLIVVPFVFMISTSLNADAWTTVPFPAQLVPDNVSFRAYEVAMEGMNLGRLYLNTLLVAVVTILLSLLSAVLSGYALSKMRPRGSNAIMILILSTMMIPAETTIIPNFLTFQKLGMINSYFPLWLPAIAYSFGTFFIKQYLDGIPTELREAARVDGANDLVTLFRIYLPLTGPVLATCTILVFLGVWNNFLWPLVVISSPSLYTLQLGIATFSTQTGGQSYLLPAVNMAATVLSIIPVLIVYALLQRFIIASVAGTAVKG